MHQRPQFLFVTCQVGAEGALKDELARHWPQLRLAYSRPGFATFKFADDALPGDGFDLHATFARSWSFSLGKLTGSTTTAGEAPLVQQIIDRATVEHFDRLHVWQRDIAPPGLHGFEPGITEAAIAAGRLIRAAMPESLRSLVSAGCHAPVKAGQHVLDCIIVEPHEWWLGWHCARAVETRWCGGICPITAPPAVVSRAYLKIQEAILWSGLPIKSGQRIAELGSAPGGASQALLDQGLLVTGIDPAVMDPRVLAHANFTHLRKRAAEVRKREFRKIRWLAADMNVAPQYTLDTVEAIVTHPEVRIRGLLLTLKLPDWSLAAEIPAYLERVRSWGYGSVRARQLQHNHQEICLAAQRDAADG